MSDKGNMARKTARRTTTQPVADDAREEGRRHMDQVLTQLWDDRFKDQSEQIAELSRTVRGFNGMPGMMERLTRIEVEINTLVDKLDVCHKLLVGEPEPVQESLTEKDLRNHLARMAVDFAKPILTAVIIWLLLTLFPDVIGHLGKP